MSNTENTNNGVDPNSSSNPDVVRVVKYDLNLSVNFTDHILSGYIDVDYETVSSSSKCIVLDVKQLTISGVVDTNTNQPLKYSVGEEHAEFGAALSIEIATDKGQFRISYATHPESSALQFLPPAQTAGKVHPYLFTQCQAIHARALLPCQDSPFNKCPYTASITVPAPLVALMSALSTGSSTSDAGITYTFEQKVPMPSYLVALGVGALEKRDIGPRSAVWSEKEMVDQGAFEFADTEKFLAAAESIAGPYVWGRYDILLLPPSFPYGGMENPCLTFVTPTLLAGDRSLANVVAHEIAHSWMGNLVSPKNWEHFWLNEGFTVFLERKIMRAIKGPAHQHLHAVIGWTALRESVEHFGADHPYTALVLDLNGVDPDDSFSSVPYEKGFNFLYYLQTIIGGEERMNEFLRAHCEKFKYISIDSYEWKAFFLEYFSDKVDAEKLAAIDWEKWYKAPGLPPANDFDRSLVDAAQNLADGHANGTVAPVANEFEGWSSNQIVVYLDRLLDDQANVQGDDRPLAAVLVTLDGLHHFRDSKNSEIRFRWYQLCLRAQDNAIFEYVVQMLAEVGRMKFVRPLYRDLAKTEQGLVVAKETFAKYRDHYHNICSKMVARDLKM